jgi:glycosyltransferase involved in cell wall biosynthesis
MKITEVTMIGVLPPLKGNAYYCLGLSQEMSRRITTEFISFKRLYPEFLYPGGVEDSDPDFDVNETATLRIRRIITYYNPITWIRAGWTAHAEVVHLQWWSIPLAPIYVVLLLVLKARKKKIVFTVHNVVPHERSIFDYRLAKTVLSFGDAFIVHSKKNRTDLIERLQLSANKVHVVHMPVHDMYRCRETGEHAVRQKLGLPQEGKIILCFGNIRPYKGIDCLIEAMPHVINSVPSAHLLIAGQNWGNWEEPYGRLIKQTEIGDYVTTLLRYIPMSEVAEIFQAVDMVVLPYRYFDAQSGIGNIALAFEIPLVVTRVGGLPELVEDGRVVCEPENKEALSRAIIPILRDKRFHSKLKGDARRLKQRYSWSAAVGETVDIYDQLSRELDC